MFDGTNINKLISLNVEGARHLDRILPFLIRENPTMIALLEAPDFLAYTLSDLGYHTSFAPMMIRTQEGQVFQEGVLVATRQRHISHPHYYYRANPDIVPFVKDDKRNSISHVALHVEIGDINLVATHFTWNKSGETADIHQKNDMLKLLAHLKELPPHILCGDMNIPRQENELYDLLCEHYTDTVPGTYHTSLDRDLHRAGDDPELSKLFDRFMVDYVFTQDQYAASDVRLEFGVSDHAAVVANVTA
ncbi:Exonuclease III [Cognatiyoonia koreensis]|uniref:Exonuclease III n=1 Tax=Cognatiyoonia koreensis TaxID=364200 RepID=A0A1I0RCL6_9RHOB|nr:endonuclease/exonuclease/phosphatase family protein [Cognatiyoonia koreensis]SEW38583.1 Exonuclease III [Cognatiyoonia koreensis]